MAIALLATVLELQKRDSDVREAEKDQTAFISRWRLDVGEVYEAIRAALAQLKAKGLVVFDTIVTTVEEESIGDYAVDQLVMTIVGRTVIASPVARMTVGGTGRIDLYRDDRPSTEDRVLIVRGAEETGHIPDVWLIEDRREIPREVKKLAAMTGAAGVRRGRRLYRPLAPDAIQDAIEHLLKLA